MRAGMSSLTLGVHRCVLDKHIANLSSLLTYTRLCFSCGQFCFLDADVRRKKLQQWIAVLNRMNLTWVYSFWELLCIVKSLSQNLRWKKTQNVSIKVKPRVLEGETMSTVMPSKLESASVKPRLIRTKLWPLLFLYGCCKKDIQFVWQENTRRERVLVKTLLPYKYLRN